MADRIDKVNMREATNLVEGILLLSEDVHADNGNTLGRHLDLDVPHAACLAQGGGDNSSGPA